MVCVSTRAQSFASTTLSEFFSKEESESVSTALFTTVNDLHVGSFNLLLNKGKLHFLNDSGLVYARALNTAIRSVPLISENVASKEDVVIIAHNEIIQCSGNRDLCANLQKDVSASGLDSTVASKVILEWGLKMLHCRVGEAIKNKTREISANVKTSLITSMKIENRK